MNCSYLNSKLVEVELCSKAMPVKKCFSLHTVAYFLVFSVVALLVAVLQGLLLFAHHVITVGNRECELNNVYLNLTVSDNQYTFTVVVHGILSSLHCLQYLLLAKQFYSFLFLQKNFPFKHSRRYYCLGLLPIALLPCLTLGLATPSLGIYKELHASKLREELCTAWHYSEVSVAYSALNYLWYLSVYAVCFMMLYTTLLISKYWFPLQGLPQQTTMRLFAGNLYTSIDSTQPAELGNSCSENYAETSTGSDSSKGSSLSTDSPALCKIIQDWNEVSMDYRDRVKKYVEIGTQVQVIEELFQTWFIVPWITQVILSSLQTFRMFNQWNRNEDSDTLTADITRVYHLLYNVNQFITLFIPYLCARKINTYHQKYYKHMRNQQLEKFEGDDSRFSFARQLVIEKQEGYDFVPRIVGTSITISMGSPLYVFFLLAGLFLSLGKEEPD